jgi:hypothetical protein
MYNSFVKGEFNLSGAYYSATAYAVPTAREEDSKLEDPCFVADSFSRVAKLCHPPMVTPINNYEESLRSFFELVSGINYDELYLAENKYIKNEEPQVTCIRIMARVIRHIHVRFNGFCRKEYLIEYFNLLVGFMHGNKSIVLGRLLRMHFVKKPSTYHQLFKAVAQLQYSLFPFRVDYSGDNILSLQPRT